MMWWRSWLVGLTTLAALVLGTGERTARVQADEDLEKLEKQRCPKPAEFAIVFSFGYAGDDMPKEAEKLESLLKKIKEGGFNTIHCTYSPARLELCKKHKVKMMVHLLADEHHVYKSPEKAKEVCEKLRDNPDVWGYNIWNDTFAKTGAGRRRDVNSVRKWDPTHPAYSGTYRTAGMSGLTNADLIGYYDFHWKRGIGQHFPHLLAFEKWAHDRDAWFYTWLATTSGIPGKGNYNRSLYSANTLIACGGKGILWFLGTEMMKRETQEWTEVGRDIVKVNQQIHPLAKEIASVGNPVAIYSTPITKTPNNEALPDKKAEMLPGGLEKQAVPKDFWLQPVSGEFVFGVFKGGAKREVVFLANHNAYQEQKVVMKVVGGKTGALFRREETKWEKLGIKDGMLRFNLEPGGGELLRFEE